ncbi:uncharacterized protein LOC144175991 isoform X3 [Haemaphysalis longicornis]
MKAVLALTLFAVVGLAYAQDDICSLPAESRASFVHCHLSEEALENFALIRREFQCEDLDCVLTKVCELSADTHAPHAGFFTPGTRAALRAVFAFCTANH